jgi:hypothetical protein
VTRSVLVLGILHELQGPDFYNYVEDRSYPKLLETAMSGVDFVFEEASGQGPSIAEGAAAAILGAERYLDIDPSADERPQYGIPRVTASGFPIDPPDSSDSCCTVDHDAQRLREEEWVRRIKGREFQKALVIVGIAHSLSLQRRLSEAGFSVKLWAYEPHAKLCRRKHSG